MYMNLLRVCSTKKVHHIHKYHRQLIIQYSTSQSAVLIIIITLSICPSLWWVVFI